MQSTPGVQTLQFGLLPEPERNPASFLTSCLLNSAILVLFGVLGTVAHHEIEIHRMESTEIVFPTSPPPPIVKAKLPPLPKTPPPPEPKIARLEAPKINLPKVEPKPEMKLPVIKEEMKLPNTPAARPAIVLAPQPKAALAAAPALTPQTRPSVEAVHLGDLNGVKPNPNATQPATIAALGNPYGGSQGQSAVPRGVVGSTGFGNGTRSGSNAGAYGKVASAGLPGGNGLTGSGGYGSGQGKVASAGIPAIGNAGSAPVAAMAEEIRDTPPVLISHAEPEYTTEARQLKIEGDVVLRVTITMSGQMLVHSVIRGLGHGLDESAMRSAPTYKFQPATRNGHPVEYTTNIIIKFQTA